MNFNVSFNSCANKKYRQFPLIRLNCWKKTEKMLGFHIISLFY